MAAMTLKSPIVAGGHPAGIYSDMSVDGPIIGTLVLIIDRAKNLPNRKSMGKQDPYCAARLGKEAHKTKVDKRGGQTPRWDQELRFVVHDSADYYSLKISCFHDDKRTELIGETFVSLKDVICPGGGQSDQWVNLKCREKYAGEVRIELTYYDSRPKEEKVVEKRKESTRPNTNNRESGVGGARQLRIPRRPLPANPTGSSPVQGTPERAFPGIVPQPQASHVTQPRAPERQPRNYQPQLPNSSNPYDFELPPRGQSEVYFPPAVPPRPLETANRSLQNRPVEEPNYNFYEEDQFAENDQIQDFRSSRGSNRGDEIPVPGHLHQSPYSQSQTNVVLHEPYIAQSAPAAHKSVPNFQQYSQFPQTLEQSAPEIPAHKPTQRSQSWNEEASVQTPQHTHLLLENSYVAEPQDMDDSPPPPPPPAHRTFGTPTEVHSVAPISSKRASPQPHGSPPEIPSASKPLSLHRAVTDLNAYEFAAANGSAAGSQQDVFMSSSQPEVFKSTSPFDRRRLSSRPVPETHHSQPLMERQSPPRRLSGDGLFQVTTPTKQPPPVPANRPLVQEQWASHRPSALQASQQTPEQQTSSYYSNGYPNSGQMSSSPHYYQQDVLHPDQNIPDESTLHRRRRSTEVARLSLGRRTGSPKSQTDSDSPSAKPSVHQNAPPNHRSAHSDSSVMEGHGNMHHSTRASGYSPPQQQQRGHIRHARSFGSPEHEKSDLEHARRHSHSPQPPHEPSSPTEDRHLAGTPFSPDSYNVLNPKAADGSLSKSISKSYQQKAPLYTSPVQVRNMPQQRRVSPRFFRRSKEPVVTADRIVDPSDHLPSSTWAPEPERKTPTAQPDTRRQAPQGAQPMPSSAKRAPRTTTSIFNRPRPHSIAGPVEEPETPGKGGPMRLFDRNRLRKSRASTVEPTPVPSSPPEPPVQTSNSANNTPAKSPYDYSWLNSTPPQHSSPGSHAGSAPRMHKDRTHYSPMYATTYEYQSSPPAHVESGYAGLPPPIPNKIPLGTPERRDQWSLEDELRSIDIGSSGGRRTTRLRQGY